jgi:hypothetical protein
MTHKYAIKGITRLLLPRMNRSMAVSENTQIFEQETPSICCNPLGKLVIRQQAKTLLVEQQQKSSLYTRVAELSLSKTRWPSEQMRETATLTHEY